MLAPYSVAAIVRALRHVHGDDIARAMLTNGTTLAAQWRGGSLSGCGVRSVRVGSGAAPQALQAGLPSVLEADSINLAAAAMVTGANCRLAQTHISGGTSKAGVTRDDLSQPVHSGARRAEKGTS